MSALKSSSTTHKYRIVDAVTKRHLIVLLYKIMEEEKPLPNYGRIHRAVKALQNMLETNYGYTLGYNFTDGGISSIYDIWDNRLQEDIERYDALGKVVDNSDVPLKGLDGYYSHELKVSSRPKGVFLLETNVKDNLQRKFGNLNTLIDKIKFACLKS